MGKALILLLPPIALLAACTTGPDLQPGQSPATPPPELPLPVEAPIEPLPEPDPSLLLDPTRLLDLPPASVMEALGVPSLVRRDANTQVMLYEAGPCVLDITLVSPDIGAGFAVHYIAARNKAGKDVAPKECLASLVDLDDLSPNQKAILLAPSVPNQGLDSDG